MNADIAQQLTDYAEDLEDRMGSIVQMLRNVTIIMENGEELTGEEAKALKDLAKVMTFRVKALSQDIDTSLHEGFKG